MTTSRALASCAALLSAALTTTTGCVGNLAATFKDVDLSVAKPAPPLTEVKPVPDKATVVIAHSGPLEGGRQAQTIARVDGTFVAQVSPRSYAVVHLPAGSHSLVSTVPELDQPSRCLLMGPFELEAGKVYVIRDGISADPAAADGPDLKFDRATLRALSLFTHLSVDDGAGSAAMKAQSSFWSACIQEAKQKQVELGIPSPPRPVGVTSLEIPAPP